MKHKHMHVNHELCVTYWQLLPKNLMLGMTDMVMWLKETVNVSIENCKNILRYYNKCVDHGFAEYHELLWF